MDFLNSLNRKSLTSIIFLENKERVLEQISNKNNALLIAGDGIYYVCNNQFALIATKVNIPYRNLILPKLEGDIIKPKIRKPSLEWLQYIIDCFKYVSNKTKNELLINIYYNSKRDIFIHDIPENQTVSAASDKYEYNKFEYDDDYVRYLQIHSHNTMSPTPSSIDNRDDQSIICFQGIIGNIKESTDVFSVDSTFRYWTGLKDTFRFVSKEIVFDYPSIEKKFINRIDREKMDKILKNSQKNQSFNNQKQTNKNLENNLGQIFEDEDLDFMDYIVQRTEGK